MRTTFAAEVVSYQSNKTLSLRVLLVDMLRDNGILALDKLLLKGAFMKIKYALPIVALVLFGCKSESGDEFSGHWVEVGAPAPMTLDITVQGSTVLVKEVKTVFGKEFRDSLTGVVVSEKEVSVDTAPTRERMVITDSSGQLHYKGRALEKTR